MTPTDIYTGQPISTDSSEHIILNSLGGRLQRRGLIDKSTNDMFGQGIDAALSASLLSFRIILNCRSGDGDPPPDLRGVTTRQGQELVLKAGGKPQQAKPDFRIDDSDPKNIKFEGSVRNMQELKRLSARVCRKYGIPFEKLEQAAESREEHVGPVDFELSFTDPVWRCIVKTAANLFALSYPEVFRRAAYDTVRKAVLGTGVDFHQLGTPSG